MKLLKLALTWLLTTTVAFAQIPISQLPNASLPLTGTETVPLNQAGTTKKAPASALGTPLSSFTQITALWAPPCNTSVLFLNGAGTCTNPSTPPGAPNNSVQFNNGGVFGGNAAFEFFPGA